MNKNTYNSLKKLLKKASHEAWEKYCDEVDKRNPVEASSYYEIYLKTRYLHIDIDCLIEDKKEAN